MSGSNASTAIRDIWAQGPGGLEARRMGHAPAVGHRSERAWSLQAIHIGSGAPEPAVPGRTEAEFQDAWNIC